MDKLLVGKKLLILGANAETSPLVHYANSMGIKTLVTSNNPADDAKQYAWKSFDVDGLDVSGIISLARKENVDGILVGVADILVPAYCKVCDALDFHCYATREIVKVFSYKDVFKATCEKYGIHGIPEYYLDEEMKKSDIDKIEYPVMVKPVDSYSGIGMSVCFHKEELGEAVKKALAASRAKRFIVEKYMECEDMGIYYTFKDGSCSASCVYDRYTTNEQDGVSRVCLGGTYPSKHIKEYFERMHENACRMFKAIGIENGILMLSAFFKDGEFYVYDTGFRLQGEAPHLLMKSIHGFDQREMLINFALTGSAGEMDLMKVDDPYFRGKWAATVWVLLKKGKICKIKGLEDIENDSRIVANIQRLHEGDEIPVEWIGTEKQVMTRMYFVCDSKKELADAIFEYSQKILVTDIEGNNMRLREFNVKEALELE
jgi:biotin carboxylase